MTAVRRYGVWIGAASLAAGVAAMAGMPSASAAHGSPDQAMRLERAVPGPSVSRAPTAVERALRAYGYLVPHPGAYARAKARAGAAADSGASSVTGPRAPASLSNFAGIRDTTGVPSDSTGAAGTGRYIELVNSKFGIYSRTNSLLGQGTLHSMIGASLSDDVFDPQVIWDPGTKRFYYAADDIRASDGHNLLAIGFSTTATPSGAADFCKYVIDYGAVDFPDFPKLGDTKNFMLIGVNVFSPTAYTGSDIIAVTKPAAGTTCPAASSFGVTIKSDVKNANGTAAFTPVPANQTDTSGTGWVVARPVSLPATFLTVFKVTRNSTTGAAVISSGSSVSVPSYTVPANAPQPGTTKVLDTADARNTQAVSAVDPLHGGKVGLWTQHTVAGGAGAEVRWYEIDPAAKTLLQSGKVTSTSLYSFNAAISPDRKVQGTTKAFGGDMVMNFNTSSSTTFPAIKVVSKVGTGAQSAPTTVVTSAGPNIDFSCDTSSEPTCRWGDYAAATPDPAASATASTGVVFGTSQYNLDGRAHPSNANWLTRNFAFRP